MRPTASTLWLAELCPASHVLPQVRESSTACSRGAAVHKYLERAPQIGKTAALLELEPAYRELCAELDPTRLPRGLREVAFAYRLDTHSAVLLGQGEARSYPDASELACGTVDVLSVSEAAVWDYKSGWPLRAAESLQLQALALYAARTFGWLRVTAGHLRIERDRLYPDAIEFGPVDLAAIHVRVARIYKRHAQAAMAPGQEVYPGPHCTSCAAAPAYPATTLLIAQVAQALNSEAALESLAAQPEKAWVFVQRTSDLIDRLRAELKRQAALSPIPLENGKRLAVVPVERRHVNGRLALPILQDALGKEALRCTTVSLGALEKVAGRAGARSLLERLAAAGAVEAATEQHLREVRAEEAGPKQKGEAV